MSPVAVDKPVPPPPQAPMSIRFPSELCSRLKPSCGSAILDQEPDIRTSVTPPAAYTDFLKAHTPVQASPPPTALSRTPSDTTNASKDVLAHVQSTSTASRISGRSTAHFRSSKAPHPPPTLPAASSQDGRASPTALRKPQQHHPMFSPVTGPSPRTAMSFTTNMSYLQFFLIAWSTSPSPMFDTNATPQNTCSKLVTVRSVTKRKVTYNYPITRSKRRKTASTTSSVWVSTFEENKTCHHHYQTLQPPSK